MRRIAWSLAAIAVAGCATAHAPMHWTYEGEEGPARWGAISPEFAACSNGKRQSPIDLVGGGEAALPAIGFDYHPGAVELLNNGHTVQATPSSGGRITVGGDEYTLTQFHFHHPSEHTVAGKRAPLEIHFVHKGARGLAVVALLVDEGGSGRVLSRLPQHTGEKVAIDGVFDPSTLLPTERSYYRYSGSLTTPPCSEGVLWLVLRTPITMSPDDLAAFAKLFPNNGRPAQPINDREILHSP